MDTTKLSAIFSDETELFRTPTEPNEGDTVSIRIRTPKGGADRVMLIIHDPQAAFLMHRKRSDSFFDIYEASIVCLATEMLYSFLIESDKIRIAYQKNGARVIGEHEFPGPEFAFHFTPGFHVPEWSKGAIQYQIFIDRFRNGNPTNDVDDNEYYYVTGHVEHKDWDEPVFGSDIRHFYGGDLQGVREKLDYLQELGVEVIYFNPIFVSPSSHKYDTQDYEHIDPHLAIINDDDKHPLQAWEKHNGYATEYIQRVTSVFNLCASDLYFAQFCDEVHKRGMKIILDGVFNHCGSFNKWMDREGIYVSKTEYPNGAFQSVKSPYRDYFKFSERGSGRYSEYEGWWGYETLPKLNYEGSAELQERILSIAEKWASPPYSIDGWRLDVAADLGHSLEYNHKFWCEFRKRVKKANPDLIIIAEHYGDPSSWLKGDQWDTVMNYDAFMEPVTFFLTGMEKHSDEYRADLYQNGDVFFRTMRDKMAKFQAPSLLCAMNELSNHDHSRFLTRTNRRVGRINTVGSEAAGQGVDKSVMRMAVTIQMTWPGSPTIYYGDEAGVVGWTDPDCRRTYPWGKEDMELIELHRDLAKLRKQLPVLKGGSVMQLEAKHGLIAYARFDAHDCAIVAVNNTDKVLKQDIHVTNIGVKDGYKFSRVFQTDKLGHSCEIEELNAVAKGKFTVTLPPNSAVILVREA